MEPYSFQALGTTWWLEIWDDISSEERSAAYGRAALLVQNFNNTYSRFLPDSEISKLNSARSLLADHETRELIQYGIDLYRRTGGVFNFLTGHILEARGYDTNYSFTDKGSDKLKAGSPLTDVVFKGETIELHGQSNIDLGGYGKGWCIDLVAEFFKDTCGLEQFLINGGGDMYVTHQDGEAVEIHLSDPHDPQKLIGSTKLKHCGFAASSPHQRRWPKVLDKQVDTSDAQLPLSDHTHIVSTTAQETKDCIYLTAPRAVEADAFATALLQVDDDIATLLALKNKLTIL